jgi:hypothetical protein
VTRRIEDITFPPVTGVRRTGRLHDKDKQYAYRCRMPGQRRWVYWFSLVTDSSRWVRSITLPRGMRMKDQELSMRICAGEHGAKFEEEIIREPNIPPETKVNLLLNLWSRHAEM